METKIEVYSKIYKKEIILLILDIQQNEFGVKVSLQDQPDLENITDFYQQKNGNFWIAKHKNEIVGTIALLDIGNKKGALRKMFVKKEFRGNTFQVGQILLDTLKSWALEKKYNKIFLGTTEKYVAAHRFYEKNNFIEIDKRELPEEFPIMKVDVIFYVLDI